MCVELRCVNERGCAQETMHEKQKSYLVIFARDSVNCAAHMLSQSVAVRT